MAPEIQSPIFSVVKSSWRHSRRLSSLFTSPMDSKRVPTVPVDSSQARRPFPGITIAAAVAFNSSEYFSKDMDSADVLRLPWEVGAKASVTPAIAAIKAMELNFILNAVCYEILLVNQWIYMVFVGIMTEDVVNEIFHE
mmetsp:Transcript_41691/g.46464  ORF Transcript_41691/g.46464 Transcript_41691/m.46464 type:complete len:139 (-) Transcript_41691:132-548(-)